MKFIPSRDLRLRTGEIFDELRKEGEMIVTANGKPASLMIPIDETNLEQTLFLIRSIKTKEAIRNMRETIRKNKLSHKDIEREIAAVKEGRW